MYLNSVLLDIQRESQLPNALNAEHLYKVNEAIFNLPEEDDIDTKMANRLFQVMQKVRTSYFDRKICDNDHNFFYDYIALLGTMQNQHFFTNRQTEKMLSWLAEALAGGGIGPSNDSAGSKSAVRYKSLEEENRCLREEYEKLLEVQDAVRVIQTFEPFNSTPESKAKAGSRKKSRKGGGDAQLQSGVRSVHVGPNSDAPESVTGEGQKKKKKKGRSAVKNSGEGGGGKKWKAKDVARETEMERHGSPPM